jgi:hypothetical protein
MAVYEPKHVAVTGSLVIQSRDRWQRVGIFSKLLFFSGRRKICLEMSPTFGDDGKTDAISQGVNMT